MIFFLNLVLGIILVFLQNTLVPTLSIQGVHIDIVLLLIVFYSLRRSAWEVVLLGGLLGFFVDMFAPSFAGASIMGYAIAAFILVNSRETFNLDRPLLHGLAIFIVCLLQKIIYLFFTGFYAEGIVIYLLISFFTALLTAVFAVGLDIVIRLVFGQIEITSNND